MTFAIGPWVMNLSFRSPNPDNQRSGGIKEGVVWFGLLLFYAFSRLWPYRDKNEQPIEEEEVKPYMIEEPSGNWSRTEAGRVIGMVVRWIMTMVVVKVAAWASTGIWPAEDYEALIDKKLGIPADDSPIEDGKRLMLAILANVFWIGFWALVALLLFSNVAWSGLAWTLSIVVCTVGYLWTSAIRYL
jgi:hypothetical protein